MGKSGALACRASEIARGLSVQLLPAKLSKHNDVSEYARASASRVFLAEPALVVLSALPRFKGRAIPTAQAPDGPGKPLQRRADIGVPGEKPRPSGISHDRQRRLIRLPPLLAPQCVGAGDWRSGFPPHAACFSGNGNPMVSGRHLRPMWDEQYSGPLPGRGQKSPEPGPLARDPYAHDELVPLYRQR